MEYIKFYFKIDQIKDREMLIKIFENVGHGEHFEKSWRRRMVV